jgi:hypothetical protein
VGRIEQIFCCVALSCVAQQASASQTTAGDEVTTPMAAEADATPAAPAAATVAEAPPGPASREPRAARVIWAAPGQAPERAPSSLPVETPAPFRLDSVRWVVGLERASSIAAYRSSTPDGSGADLVTSGVEASIVGRSSQDAVTPLVLPRLSLDGRWANGVSLGFVVSYAARSATTSTKAGEEDLPSSESALFGPRVGWLKPVSNNVAFWLRGGPTWTRRASSERTTTPGELVTSVETQWAISLEPQVVVMPLRHLGLSLGAAFDIGFAGESKVTASGGPHPGVVRSDTTLSAYGVTVGLLALF